jgi:endonuclease/exonuclease/phosphatase family metal-dependent hydrolase
MSSRNPHNARTRFILVLVLSLSIASFIGASSTLAAPAPPQFTVATFNLENYLHVQTGTRPAKSETSKAAIRQAIHALNADVLALQEMGSTHALLELRDSLRAEGLSYPHWEHVSGFDTNIHIAILSRYPVTAQRHHTNESFLLYGRRFHVRRAFAEVDIRVHPHYQFTLINAHLKSRLQSGTANQADLREQEATRLRRIIDARLQANPNLNLIVVGDLNDHQDSQPLRIVRGRGSRQGLIDTRPAERRGADAPPAESPASHRQITWTSYYSKEDSYSRVDYILLSPGMAREWDRSGTFILTLPNWGTASDHRPIIARFHAQDR